jgi:hypothetical protein
MLTALDQIIAGALAKRSLFAAEEQAERTLAEEHCVLKTHIREPNKGPSSYWGLQLNPSL